MSFRNKAAIAVEAKVEVLAGVPPEPIPPRLVFAEGICDICQKAMHTHKDVDCRGNAFELLDVPDEEIRKLREAALKETSVAP